MSATEWLKGWNACSDGKKCPEDASQDFQKGYGACYAWEQVRTDFELNKHRREGMRHD